MTKLILPLVLLAVPALAQQPVTRILVCTDAGANDAYSCSPTVALGSYTTGLRVQLFANTINTGSASVDISTLGAKTIKKRKGAITVDLEDGDIRAGSYVDLVYDGTNFQMLSDLGNYPPQPLTWTLHGGGSVLTATNGPARYVKTDCYIPVIVVDGDQSGSVTVVLEVATYTTGTPTWSTLATVTLSSVRSAKDTTGYSVAADRLVRANITGTPATMTYATVDARCN